MEKIEPQADHEKLGKFPPGTAVEFNGKIYRVQRRTTLASGEAAVVLQGESEQFMVSAAQLIAAAKLLTL